jgi:16S rRNA G966 N2-methylase RsmD
VNQKHASDPHAAADTYDRQLLLLGRKRNRQLELWEVQRYGSDSYGDADYVSIYGLPPATWYEKGIRLLGRTAVECTRDQLADAIGRDIAKTAMSAPAPRGMIVIDPFAGSGNTLYWILHHLPQAQGLGFELDQQVFQVTKRNLSILGLPIEIRCADCIAALSELNVPDEQVLIAFIAPPWGDALSASTGLDLLRTTPPVTEIVDMLAQQFPNRLLFSIQVYETIDPASLAEVTARFEWSALRTYDFNPRGQNHGLLLGTSGWRPEPSRTTTASGSETS